VASVGATTERTASTMPSTPFDSAIFRDVFGGEEIDGGVTVLAFSSYNFGNTNNPQSSGERVYNLRDDFTTSFNAGGRHDVRTGVEYIRYTMDTAWCNNCNGRLGFNVAPPANIEQLFPVWNDISTWNLNALSPITRFYQLAVGNFESNNPITSVAGWAQDDWTMGRLTLNLGVRYDIIKGTYGEERGFDPWLAPDRPHRVDHAGDVGVVPATTPVALEQQRVHRPDPACHLVDLVADVERLLLQRHREAEPAPLRPQRPHETREPPRGDLVRGVLPRQPERPVGRPVQHRRQRVRDRAAEDGAAAYVVVGLSTHRRTRSTPGTPAGCGCVRPASRRTWSRRSSGSR